jgi:hypothetical protein
LHKRRILDERKVNAPRTAVNDGSATAILVVRLLGPFHDVGGGKPPEALVRPTDSSLGQRHRPAPRSRDPTVVLYLYGPDNNRKLLPSQGERRQTPVFAEDLHAAVDVEDNAEVPEAGLRFLDQAYRAPKEAGRNRPPITGTAPELERLSES